MTTPIGVTFEVAPLTDLLDRTDITDQLQAVDYSKPLNEEGRGSLTVPYGETITPDPHGQAIVLSVAGEVVGTVLVSTKTDTEVDRGGHAEMVTQYVGKGLAAVLERMRVRPVLGFGRSPFGRRRAYTPFSLEYDYSGWSAATEYGTVSTSSPHWGMFSGFPDFDVPRIGPAEGDENGAPQGYWLWQGQFSLPDGVGLAVFELVDNSEDLYFQSFQLSRVKLDGQVGSFTTAQRYDFDYVSPGTIRVGGRAVNVPFGGGDPGPGAGAELDGNPTFVAVVILELFPDGRLGDVLFQTSAASCKVLSYPNPLPGMTDLEVIEAIVTDNPNASPQVTVIGHGSFDEQPSITVRVGGDNLLQHLRNRADASFIDWDVVIGDTGEIELHVWPAGDRGSSSGVTWVTTDATLQHLTVTELTGGPDCVHVAYEGGDVLVGGEGERMAYLETDATTIDEAKARGLAALATPDPTEVAVDIAPLVGAIPGVDVKDGDTVTAGGHANQRLNQWEMRWPDDNGEPAYRVELGDRIREQAERQALILERSSPGHMGGTAPGNPAPDSPYDGRRSDFESHKWTISKDPDADYVTGEADVDDLVGTSMNLCAFRFSAKTLTSGTATLLLKVDGVTQATASLTSSTPNLSVTVKTDERVWVVAGFTRMTLELTAVGVGLGGIEAEALGVI